MITRSSGAFGVLHLLLDFQVQQSAVIQYLPSWLIVHLVSLWGLRSSAEPLVLYITVYA